SRVDAKDAFARLLDAPRDPEAVHRLEAERLEDQHVERAGNHVGRWSGHGASARVEHARSHLVCQDERNRPWYRDASTAMTTSRRARPAGLVSVTLGVVSVCLGLGLGLRAAPLPQTNATADELKQAEADVPQLVSVLEITPGMFVADVGAGAGAMTMVMARKIGPDGHVYATELNPLQITAIRTQVASEGLKNVTTIEAGKADTNL